MANMSARTYQTNKQPNKQPTEQTKTTKETRNLNIQKGTTEHRKIQMNVSLRDERPKQERKQEEIKK